MRGADEPSAGRGWVSVVFGAVLLLGCGGRSISGAVEGEGASGPGGSGGAGGLDAGGGANGQAGVAGAMQAVVGGASTGVGAAAVGGAGATTMAAGGSGASAGAGGTPPMAACPPPVELGSAQVVSIQGNTRDGSNRQRGSCGGDGNEVSFVWQVSATGRYQIDTLGSTADTVLYLQGVVSCDTVEDFACSDDSFAGTGSWLVEDFVAGAQVVIVVDTYQEPGPFVLNVRPVEPSTCPDGDLGSALGTPVVTGVATLDGQPADDDNACNGGPPRFDYQWRAPHDGVFVFNTLGSDYDTVLLLRNACFGADLQCNDDTNGKQSVASLSMAEGQSIIVEVATFRGETCVDCPAPRYQLNIEELLR